MGLKEKMMEGMMGNMTPEEKQEMMNSVMDHFFSTMTPEEKRKMMEGMMGKFMTGMTSEEKQAMMRDMMPKMMGGMMGGGSGPMMGMMSAMMGKMMGGGKEGEAGGEKPWDMCRKMMGNLGKSLDLAAYATPELHLLFEEWLKQVNEEILEFIATEGKADPDALAAKFKLGRDSIHFILGKLAQAGKINLNAEKK
jgi:hypothetical protein